jgi:hypothetical protein
MEKRSESDILRKTFTLTFHVEGKDKEYTVPVHRRGKAREWRDQYLKRTRELAQAMGLKLDEHSPDLTKDFSKMLERVLLKGFLEFPDALPDLIASYVGEAVPKEVLDNAYDQEIELAFKAIWGVAFRPFLSTLGMSLETGKALESSSQKSNAVN